MRRRLSEKNDNTRKWLNVNDFTKPNGSIVRNQDRQLAFWPNPLPPNISYDDKMVALLIKAEGKVGELRGKGSMLENPRLIVTSYIRREAVLSSKIEGTTASLEDLNRHDVVGNNAYDSNRLRIREVINYVHAFTDVLGKMQDHKLALSLETILHLHKLLMHKVPGYEDIPGKLRTQQNYITNHSHAIYTPPPHDKIHQLLSNLVDFIQTDTRHTPLIQCAIIHYQFEAIHPFVDGNGRVGRLLIPLVLHQTGTLPEPLLNLSDYFEQHRQEYYDKLLKVSQKSKWSDWIEFFLNAFIEQADKAIQQIQQLTDLQVKYKEILQGQYKKGNAIRLLESLFANSHITIPKAANILQVTHPTARKAVTDLVNARIVRYVPRTYSPKLFVADEIANITSTT